MNKRVLAGILSMVMASGMSAVPALADDAGQELDVAVNAEVKTLVPWAASES